MFHVLCLSPQSATRGETISRTFDVLLRGSQVRARVSVFGTGAPIHILTPVLHVHLGPREAPSIHFTSGTVRALVMLPPGVPRAALYYTDWYVCGQGKNAYVAGTVFEEQLPTDGRLLYPVYSGLMTAWVRTSAMQITTMCAHPQEWHIAVAIEGETAAYATYIQHGGAEGREH